MAALYKTIPKKLEGPLEWLLTEIDEHPHETCAHHLRFLILVEVRERERESESERERERERAREREREREQARERERERERDAFIPTMIIIIFTIRVFAYNKFHMALETDILAYSR